MSEITPKNSFIPYLGFNDPIFIKIDNKIRPFLDKKPTDLNRELQIRTLLYANFSILPVTPFFVGYLSCSGFSSYFYNAVFQVNSCSS